MLYGTYTLRIALRRQPGTKEERNTSRVKPDTKIPSNWAAFLMVDKNKEELFHFLADQLVSVEAEHGQVISTKGDSVVCNGQRDDISSLAPCKHEEADTRLLLHAADAGKCGFTKIMLRTVDTDVLVIAIATFDELTLSELWIAFGVGKHFRFVPVHDIASSMGQQKSELLHFTPLPDLTTHPHLLTTVRRLRGIHGQYVMK